MASNMAVGGYWILWRPVDPQKVGIGDRLPSLQDCIANAQKRVRRAGGIAIVLTRRDYGPYIVLRTFGHFRPGMVKPVEGEPFDLDLKTRDGIRYDFRQAKL